MSDAPNSIQPERHLKPGGIKAARPEAHSTQCWPQPKKNCQQARLLNRPEAQTFEGRGPHACRYVYVCEWDRRPKAFRQINNGPTGKRRGDQAVRKANSLDSHTSKGRKAHSVHLLFGTCTTAQLRGRGIASNSQPTPRGNTSKLVAIEHHRRTRKLGFGKINTHVLKNLGNNPRPLESRCSHIFAPSCYKTTSSTKQLENLQDPMIQ